MKTTREKNHPIPDPQCASTEMTINNLGFTSSHTSNDLWSRLDADHPRLTAHYAIVAQSADEVQDIENAPSVSMGPYLVDSGKTQLLTTISIYGEPGASRDQVRLLYMNAAAMLVWKAMGRNPTLIGAQHRPPRTALLVYGVPFSE